MERLARDVKGGIPHFPSFQLLILETRMNVGGFYPLISRVLSFPALGYIFVGKKLGNNEGTGVIN